MVVVVESDASFDQLSALCHPMKSSSSTPNSCKLKLSSDTCIHSPVDSLSVSIVDLLQSCIIKDAMWCHQMTIASEWSADYQESDWKTATQGRKSSYHQTEKFHLYTPMALSAWFSVRWQLKSLSRQIGQPRKLDSPQDFIALSVTGVRMWRFLAFLV